MSDQTEKVEIAWYTADELKFIRMIGARAEASSNSRDKQAFFGYAASIGKRKQWTGIDKARVLDEIKTWKVKVL